MLRTTNARRQSKMTSRSYRLFNANAAFLHDIKEDEKEVAEVMNAVTQRLAADYLNRFATAQLLDQLERLCEIMEHRSRLEDAIGYMDEVVRIAPGLSDRATVLMQEHRPLWIQLRRVCELAIHLLRQSDATERTLGQVRDAFGSFRDQYNAHEAREAELIIDLMYFDIGSE